MKYLSTTIICLLIIVFSFNLQPVSANNYILKFGTVVTSDSPWGKIAQKYINQIKSESKGRLEIKIYWAGSLGTSDQMVRMVRQNRLQAMGVSAFSFSNILPEIQVISLPYMFEDDDQAEEILDKKLFNPIAEKLRKKGFELLGWSGGSWSGIGTKDRFILKPEDIKGLKTAIPGSDFIITMWKSLGGNGVKLSSSEVLNAMQTKMVDAFVGMPEIVSSAQWYKTIKYYTYTKDVYVPGMIIVSKSFWDKLPDDLKNIIKTNINEMLIETRNQNHDLPNKILKAFNEAGIKTHIHTQAERNLFKSKTLFIKDDFINKYGSELINLIK